VTNIPGLAGFLSKAVLTYSLAGITRPGSMGVISALNTAPQMQCKNNLNFEILSII
jgi:hypothetical protein